MSTPVVEADGGVVLGLTGIQSYRQEELEERHSHVMVRRDLGTTRKREHVLPQARRSCSETHWQQADAQNEKGSEKDPNPKRAATAKSKARRSRSHTEPTPQMGQPAEPISSFSTLCRRAGCPPPRRTGAQASATMQSVASLHKGDAFRCSFQLEPCAALSDTNGGALRKSRHFRQGAVSFPGARARRCPRTARAWSPQPKLQ